MTNPYVDLDHPDVENGLIMISPALIRAHGIEQNLREPVIKVEGAVAIDHDRLFKKLRPKIRPPTKPLKARNLYYLPSYFVSSKFSLLPALLSNPHEKEWFRTREVKEEIAALKQIRKNIHEALRNSDPNVTRKWKFVRRVFNAHVKPLSKKWKSLRGLRI